MNKPILIGITGGTGSGKSTIADALYSNFSKDCIAMIQQDMYYKDQSHLSMEERVKTNYDHPMAFDNDLLVEHLKKLIKGESIEKPSYDFTLHNRAKETTTVESRHMGRNQDVRFRRYPPHRSDPASVRSPGTGYSDPVRCCGHRPVRLHFLHIPRWTAAYQGTGQGTGSYVHGHI